VDRTSARDPRRHRAPGGGSSARDERAGAVGSWAAAGGQPVRPPMCGARALAGALASPVAPKRCPRRAAPTQRGRVRLPTLTNVMIAALRRATFGRLEAIDNIEQL